MRTLLLAALLLVCTSCKPKPPEEHCKDACARLTTCNDATMLALLDCQNLCKGSKAYPECPECLSGTHGTCDDIAGGRVCNSSCRPRR